MTHRRPGAAWVGHRACALLATLALALLPAAAVARTLHWSRLDVSARLDADGRLHVRESQAMVFTGDWNGGERVFRLRGDQSLELHGISRVDPETLATTELTKGSLSFVDQYDWHDRRTLRWRSRLPSDPVFDNTTIVYVLDYTLSGALDKGWRSYRLDHDFAFPERYGAIERFTLTLELDPAWRPREELPPRFEAQNLFPGESFVVTRTLDYVGPGRPAGLSAGPPAAVRLLLILAALAAITALFQRFQRFERHHGRYEPADMPVEPDRRWLEQHVLALRPEEVGALWDQVIGPAEVSALLARLVAEGKLKSWVEKGSSRRSSDVLHLELLVDRDSLESYERKLVDKLFFGDRTQTSTEAVRKHYKSSGFSPTSAISAKLQKRLDKILGFGTKQAAPSKKPGLILLALVVACVVLELVTRRAGVGPLIGTLLLGTVPAAIVGLIGVHWRRRKADRLRTPTLLFMIPLLLILAALYVPVLLGQLVVPMAIKLSWLAMAALLLWGVAVANSFFNNARTRDGAEAIRRRKQLAAVRRYFQAELGRPEPRLDDEWFPYLLAFGLAKEVDRWSVTHGGAALASSTRSGSFSGGTGGWSGGGGRFGGAGATASWAAAAGGLAAGIASPSSSSSGGGGGGGSSGGGGGGGW